MSTRHLHCHHALLSAFVLVALSYHAARAEPAEPKKESAAPHPERRVVASPADDVELWCNPPTLLWPIDKRSRVRYEVRLAPAGDFSASEAIAGNGLQWAMFNPHRKLAEGNWVWQHRAVRDAAQDAPWSSKFRFVVPSGVRSAVTPSAQDWIAGIPDRHPRIYVAADQWQALRDRAVATDRLHSTVRAADRLLEQSVRGIQAALPKTKGKTPFEAKNFAKWASKAYANRLLGEVKTLTFAYVLSGDRKYAAAAVARGMVVAGFDPNGPTSRKVSDFADGSCMEAMALVYDSCYDQLTAQQRDVMRDAMLARVTPWFDRQMNDLESRVFSAHIWQHILQQATEVALALHGDVPEAEVWLCYVYELWQARVPLLGGEDGGWANGVNYFGTNFKTLLEMPVLFERYTTGADFFGHPWYRNSIYYQLYAWPPGSASDGFGDGSERGGTPSLSRAMFVGFLGERFSDPAALWYARKVAGDRSMGSLLTPLLWVERVLGDELSDPPEPKLPDEIPASRVFRDIGEVVMHTNLSTPRENCMLAFRSSPFGSYNHMHSDQNSFNLIVGGRRLFAGSGYYIGYGDQHFKDWYTHTRGHNSILIDDRGQVRGAEGYGAIVRYLHGRQITYCVGDASAAYGDAGVTRFRRHVVFLRPSTVVVYDDLEADHAAQWTWLLHSMVPVSAHDNGWTVTIEQTDIQQTDIQQTDARVLLFSNDDLQLSVDDRFEPPAVNWRNKTSGGKVLEYPDQWHMKGEPSEPLRATRFLAVIQFATGAGGEAKSVATSHGDGIVRVNGWRIEAALDVDDAASLGIQSFDGRAGLGVNGVEIQLLDEVYFARKQEASLIEDGGKIELRCKDWPMR